MSCVWITCKFAPSIQSPYNSRHHQFVYSNVFFIQIQKLDCASFTVVLSCLSLIFSALYKLSFLKTVVPNPNKESGVSINRKGKQNLSSSFFFLFLRLYSIWFIFLLWITAWFCLGSKSYSDIRNKCIYIVYNKRNQWRVVTSQKG